MAVHLELRLIGKIVEEQNIKPFIKKQIDSDKLFLQPEARAMFDEIWAYYHNPNHYGKIPTKEYMKGVFSSFLDIPPQTESVEELLEFVRQNTLSFNILDLLERTYEILQTNPNDALRLLRNQAMDLATTTGESQDVFVQDSLNDVIKRYLERKNGITRGLPFPWPEVTERTHGLSPGQFCVLYGRYKTGKSALAIWWAAYLYLWSNQRVLFYSPEIGRQELPDRVACALQHLDWDRFLSGKLTEKEEKELFITQRLLLEQHAQPSTRSGFLLCTDLARERTGTIALLRHKIEEFRPDIIFADSFYKFAGSKGKVDLDWKQMGGHCTELKTLATEYNIPVVGITQANAKNEAAFANTVLMSECDLALRLRGKDTEEGRLIGVNFEVARTIRGGAFKILFSLYTKAKFLGWVDPDLLDQEIDTPMNEENQPINRTTKNTGPRGETIDKKILDKIRTQFMGPGTI